MLKSQRIFDGCRSSETGLNLVTAELGRLRAIRLYNSTIEFAKIRDLIRQATRANAWLIFYTHDVDEAPSRFGCTPALFEDTVNAAVSSDAELLPVSEGMRKICGRIGK
jgi:hypothetical protein